MNIIFKNSLFNILRAIISVPLFFIIIPYIIKKIGVENYGVWSLIGIISSYRAFIDMGFNNALIRYVAKEKAKNNYNQIQEYITFFLLIYLLLGIVIISIVYGFENFILIALGLNKSIPDVKFLLIFSVFASVINMIASVYKSLLDGFQRMDITNFIMILFNIISFLGTYFLLEAGLKLKGLAINLVMTSLFSLSLNIFFAKLVFKRPLILFKRIKLNKMKEILFYSFHLQLASLTKFWIEPINKIAISHFFGVDYVGFYDVALKFVNRVRSLFNSALTPILPASAETFEVYGFNRVENLRINSIKYIYPFATVLYGMIFLFSRELIFLWLGSEMIIVARVIQIFVIGIYLVTLAVPTYIILNGLGFSKITFYIQLSSMFVNLLGIFVFSYFYGFYGFCSAYTFSVFFSFTTTNVLYKKVFKLNKNVFNVYKNYKLIIIGIFVLLLGDVLKSLFHIKTLVDLLILNSFLIFSFFLLIVLLRILTKEDIVRLFNK